MKKTSEYSAKDAEKTLEHRNVSPCPFCNSKKVKYYRNGNEVAIQCKNCKAIGPINVVDVDNPYSLNCVELALDDWDSRREEDGITAR